MLDDIRDHDPVPTAEEQAWANTDALGLVLKALGLAALAIAIGVSVSQVVVPDSQPARVTLGSSR